MPKDPQAIESNEQGVLLREEDQGPVGGVFSVGERAEWMCGDQRGNCGKDSGWRSLNLAHFLLGT